MGWPEPGSEASGKARGTAGSSRLWSKRGPGPSCRMQPINGRGPSPAGADAIHAPHVSCVGCCREEAFVKHMWALWVTAGQLARPPSPSLLGATHAFRPFGARSPGGPYGGPYGAIRWAIRCWKVGHTVLEGGPYGGPYGGVGHTVGHTVPEALVPLSKALMQSPHAKPAAPHKRAGSPCLPFFKKPILHSEARAGRLEPWRLMPHAAA